MPQVRFAAVPTWGTNAADRAALAARPNIAVLDPVDDIDELLARTRVLLVPSLWAEARSRIVVEAMLRGVPVIGANVGGIPEAKMGVRLPAAGAAHRALRPARSTSRWCRWPRCRRRISGRGTRRWTGCSPTRRITGSCRAHRARRRSITCRSLSAEPFETLLAAFSRAARSGLRRRQRHAPRRSGRSRSSRRRSAGCWRCGCARCGPCREPLVSGRGSRAGGLAAAVLLSACGRRHSGFSLPGARALPGRVPICPARLPGRESRLSEASVSRA